MIELRQLQYFVAVGEELHFGRAAARLRISKPTLSQQVRVLERSLGAELLSRGHHLRLTEPGEVLLREARQLLVQYSQLQASVTAAARHPASLDVRITSGLDVVLRRQLAHLGREGAPELNLVLTNGLDAEEAVVAGRADAALVWAPTGTHSSLHAELIGHAQVSLAMPRDHRLAAQDAVAVTALREEPIVLFPRPSGPGVYDAFAAHLFPDGGTADRVRYPPGPVVRMADLLQQVLELSAVAPFVHEVAATLCPSEIVLRPLDPPLQIAIHLVSRDPQSPRLQALATLLRAGTQEGAARPERPAVAPAELAEHVV